MSPVVTYAIQLKRKVFHWYFKKRLRALPSNQLVYELQIKPIIFMTIKEGLRDFIVVERDRLTTLREGDILILQEQGWGVTGAVRYVKVISIRNSYNVKFVRIRGWMGLR